MTHTIETQVAKQFPRDIQNHEMKVLMSETGGVCRHIRCGVPGSFNHHFNITTWPGYLAISGDMGTYVFTRLPDMFQFFRNPDGRINPSYWAEKLVATDVSCGHKVFDVDAFRSHVMATLDDYILDQTIENIEHIYEEFVEALNSYESYDHLYTVVTEFEINGDPVFTEVWEMHSETWTYHFIWCLHAIVWTIQQVDALPQQAVYTE